MNAQFVAKLEVLLIEKTGVHPNAPPVRDGDSLVLAQDITASDGTKGKNTVRYSLEDNGNTLIEDEKEETPLGTRRIVGFRSERRIMGPETWRSIWMRDNAT